VTPDQQSALDVVSAAASRTGVAHPRQEGLLEDHAERHPDVLSPRPDTEAILDVARSPSAAQRAFEMIDLGTGSVPSCWHPRPSGLGARRRHHICSSLAVAENATNPELDNRATFLRTEWPRASATTASDLVVSNPPYIPSATSGPRPRGPRPRSAAGADGGPDGLTPIANWP
jgi:release factor glutamine methyltransferase